MKKRISIFFCLLLLISITIISLASEVKSPVQETVNQTKGKQMIWEGKNIQNKGPIVINGRNNLASISRKKATRNSFLDVDSNLFTSSSVKEKNHDFIDSYGYEENTSYSTFSDGASLYVSDNGVLRFTQPVGAAYNQIISYIEGNELQKSKEGELTFLSKEEAIQKSISLLNTLGISIAPNPIESYSLSKAQVLSLAKKFDDMMRKDGMPKGFIENDVKNTEGFYYFAFPLAYGDLNTGSFYYQLPVGERMIEMDYVKVIVAKEGIAYLEAAQVYQETGEADHQDTMIPLQEAFRLLEEKMNEEILFETYEIIETRLEYVVKATGNTINDYELVPCWHMVVIPTELFEEKDIHTPHMLNTMAAHYCLAADTGEWIQ